MRGTDGRVSDRPLDDLGTPGTGRRVEVAGAGRVAGVGVKSPPVSRPVSQSCGRHNRSDLAATSGSCSASQRNFVTVNDAT